MPIVVAVACLGSAVILRYLADRGAALDDRKPDATCSEDVRPTLRRDPQTGEWRP